MSRTLELAEEHIKDLEARIEHMKEAVRRAYEMKLGRDDAAPFFTEVHLYKRLGKEQARSVLAMLHHIEAPFDMRDGRPLPGQWRQIQEHEEWLRRHPELEEDNGRQN